MLYSEKMKQILEKFGVDTSTLTDNLYSTLLDAIYNADISSGGGSSSKNTITLDSLLSKYRNKKIVIKMDKLTNSLSFK